MPVFKGNPYLSDYLEYKKTQDRYAELFDQHQAYLKRAQRILELQQADPKFQSFERWLHRGVCEETALVMSGLKKTNFNLGKYEHITTQRKRQYLLYEEISGRIPWPNITK